jgi:hypothetical protein
MRGFGTFCGAIAAATLYCALPSHAQTAVKQPSPSEAVAGQEGCEIYLTLQPLDPAALKLLATPIVPANRTVFTDASIKQLQDWDLPSKVSAWRERPSAEELARQWEELNKKWNAGAQNKTKKDVPQGYAAPYAVHALPAKQWQDLEKWLGKTAPKKLSGLCVDPAKATYVLAVGIISGGAGVSANDPNRVQEYSGYASKPQGDSLGPNAGTVAPYRTPHDEFTGSEMSNGLSGNTCVYLYRTNGKAMGEGGTRQEAPDYYYCHAGGSMSQSAVTTMLKYLTKTGLPGAPRR